MRILIAEDEPVSRLVLQRALTNWGHEVVVACDGLEAAHVLEQANPPRLAILDWMMPGLNGVHLCRDIRGRTTEAYTYILLLTSKRGIRNVVEGLESGADDYLVKPFDPQELKMRLRTGERILDLLEQLVAAREVVRDLALHDALTGLWNRAGILGFLDQELDRARRDGASLGLVLMDLDEFKSINDTFGHLVGDEALRAAARAIRATIRPYDFAGRYGGDELLIVLPGCNELNAVGQAERVRAALQGITLRASAGIVPLSASLGVAVARVDLQANQLLEAADAALYRAKRKGRNWVEAAGPADYPNAARGSIPQPLVPAGAAID